MNPIICAIDTAYAENHDVPIKSAIDWLEEAKEHIDVLIESAKSFLPAEDPEGE